MDAKTLVCLPYAGGAAYSYRSVLAHLPPGVATLSLEPPGRGRRIGEPPLTDLHAMANDLLGQLAGRPPESLVLYGHSMGAVLAYLLAHRLREGGGRGPAALVVSGRAGPMAPKVTNRLLHRLSTDELGAELAKYGAIPSQILEDPELMAFFEPIIRADFKAVEEYRHTPLPPLPIPITLLIGENDTVTPERALIWGQESTLPLSVHRFLGGHFFIFEEAKRVASALHEAIVRS